MSKISSVLWILACAMTFISCGSDSIGDSYSEVPKDPFFGSPIYDPQNYELTEKGFLLGRRLFFDPILSLDNSVSCNTCHDQSHAFADHNVPFSMGVDGKIGPRNSPGLFNLAWKKHFMWDGGINHLEVVSIAPIEDSLEMNIPLREVLKKLNQSTTYQKLFQEVYGQGPINSFQMLTALAQYMAQLVSNESKYDQVLRGKSKFTPMEQQGFDLFQTHCQHCHTPPLFTDQSYRNNGLSSYRETEFGRARVTLLETDRHLFAVPSLRNLAFTYPYMHNGSMRSLEQVIDHYSDHMILHPNLDPFFKIEGNVRRLQFSKDEKEALISFINTLNDYEFIKKYHFSE